MKNSQPIQITKTQKLGGSLSKKPALKRKPRVWLDNLLVELQKDQKSRVFNFTCCSLRDQTSDSEMPSAIQAEARNRNGITQDRSAQEPVV